MAIASKIRTDVRRLLRTSWSERDGTVVPKTEDLSLSNGAVNLDAVFLYADMANSTWFAHNWTKYATANVIRAFLSAATQVIRAEGGEIRSFDGDRVMGIFIGNAKCSTAARCALKINYAVRTIVDEELRDRYNDYDRTPKIGHCTGVALGEAMLVRGGVRGNNDLVSIGTAPNIAAKLSAIRTGYSTYIATEVRNQLNEASVIGSDGRNMWSQVFHNIGGQPKVLYASTWWWEP